MTDFDAFSPDPIAGDDPFAADGDSADPFADGGEQTDDPFAASGQPQADDDPFAASAYAPDADADDDNATDLYEEEEAQGASELYGDEGVQGQEDTPVTLEDSEVALPQSTILGEWQSERREVLSARSASSRGKKQEATEVAKQEMAKFLADRQARITKMKSTNREEETNNLAEMAQLMEHGSQWEKVHKLVNLNPKPNEKKGACRVDRMRALLVQMKYQKDA